MTHRIAADSILPNEQDPWAPAMRGPDPEERADTDSNELERVAYHEAGHAVVSIHGGRGLRRVSIVPREESLGCCLSRRLPKSFQPHVRVDGRARTILEGEVMTCLAGETAEWMFSGERDPFAAEHDLQAAFSLASHFVGDDHELDAYMEWLAIRTENLLRLDHVWEGVENLARALLDEKTIGARRGRAIVLGRERVSRESA